MRGRIVPPVLLGTAWLLSFFAPLLSPGTILANRDVPVFHLPLRAAFAWLAAEGLPVWNPWLHGGQPVLSNPSYAAFYPPSWLALVLPPGYALNLIVVLHAGIAFAGAWWLARRLGSGRAGAALAALGYTGSGALLSLLSALTLFCSMAWFPWFLGWIDEALRSERWRRPALLAGGVLGLQLLNGEPVTVVVSGLGLLALAAGRPRAALRTLVPLALAVALAAVQWLPTAARFAHSPRAGGLDAGRASVWSAPPARLVELVFPRFFGDPMRDQEGLYFGWNLHDRDFPYVPSVYPGLLLGVLGIAALARWPVPRRSAWALAAVAGAFLALGRYNPLFEPLREAVPLLATLRFPEKFAILTVAALTFCGALGWDWLLRERGEGRPERADFPLALSLVLLAVAGILTGLLYGSPLAGWFVRSHGEPGLSPEGVARGEAFLRGEGWAALASTAAVAGLLALCRWRRPSSRMLAAAAVLLLAADLWHYGHGLVETAPAGILQGPPPVAPPAPDTRLFVQEASADQPEAVLRAGGAASGLRAQVQRMEPYSAVLWRIPYALNEDFDLMLTRWGSWALGTLHQDWERSPNDAWRYLGIWSAGKVLLRKDLAAWSAELARDPDAPRMREMDNPYLLPRHRFVPRVTFHAELVSALAAARTSRYQVMRHEHVVGPPGERTFPRPPEPLELEERGGWLRMRYRSESPAFFVLSETFDEGWEATLESPGGAPLTVHPTAAAQIGIELPAGEHVLVLRYRERWLPLGAAVTLATLATLAGIASVAGIPGIAFVRRRR